MKNKKIKIAYLITTFIFLFTYIGGTLGSIESYAYDNTYVALISSSGSSSKPSSGSFKSSTKSYSTKPKTTTIKPDSGSFSTKPNTSTKNSGSSSTIKPDSGSFSRKPKDNSSNNNESNGNKNSSDYSGSGGSSSSGKSIFGGSYYGGYSSYRRGFFGYRGISSWIMKLVILITAIVVIYIIFDYIRSKRD